MRTFARYSPVDMRITNERILGRLDKSFLRNRGSVLETLGGNLQNVIRHPGIALSVSRRALVDFHWANFLEKDWLNLHSVRALSLLSWDKMTSSKTDQRTSDCLARPRNRTDNRNE